MLVAFIEVLPVAVLLDAVLLVAFIEVLLVAVLLDAVLLVAFIEVLLVAFIAFLLVTFIVVLLVLLCLVFDLLVCGGGGGLLVCWSAGVRQLVQKTKLLRYKYKSHGYSRNATVQRKVEMVQKISWRRHTYIIKILGKTQKWFLVV